jgi:DNA modification methylase
MRIETIGNATLYCGGCMEVFPTLEAHSFDLCVTDPPYMFTMASSGSGKLNPLADAMNGARFYTEWYRLVKDKLPDNGALWTFGNWRTFAAMQIAFWNAAWDLTSLLVWNKDWPGTGQKGLRNTYELVALAAKPGFTIKDRSLRDIQTFKWQAPLGKTGHPAEKPDALMRWLIEISAASCVLDPFMGSGTTGVAALHLGLNFIGVEMDEHFFDIACKRIEAAAKDASARLIDAAECL